MRRCSRTYEAGSRPTKPFSSKPAPPFDMRHATMRWLGDVWLRRHSTTLAHALTQGETNVDDYVAFAMQLQRSKLHRLPQWREYQLLAIDSGAQPRGIARLRVGCLSARRELALGGTGGVGGGQSASDLVHLFFSRSIAIVTFKSLRT